MNERTTAAVNAVIFATASVSLLFFLSGCALNPAGPGGSGCSFYGITQVTAAGDIISEDPDDWCLDDDPDTPGLFAWPNPVDRMLVAGYAVPAGGQAVIRVMAQGCRHIRTLLNTNMGAGGGAVVWDLRDESGHRVTPGIYRILFEGEGQCHGDVLVLSDSSSKFATQAN